MTVLFPECYEPRLLQLVGGRKDVMMKEVGCWKERINSDDVFVLDAGLRYNITDTVFFFLHPSGYYILLWILLPIYTVNCQYRDLQVTATYPRLPSNQYVRPLTNRRTLSKFRVFRILQFNGTNANKDEQMKAAQFCAKLKSERPKVGNPPLNKPL